MTPNFFECDLTATSFYTSTCVHLYPIAPPRFDIGHTNSLCIFVNFYRIKMGVEKQEVTEGPVSPECTLAICLYRLGARCAMHEAENNSKLP